jgi:hypothetical protein
MSGIRLDHYHPRRGFATHWRRNTSCHALRPNERIELSWIPQIRRDSLKLAVPPEVEFEEERESPLDRPVRAGPQTQPQPQLSTDIDVIKRLRLVLVEKIREIPADDLEKVREYIKEIKELEAQEKQAEAQE